MFIAAACALALVGCRLQRSWLTVIGLVIATAKPQLSFPLLLFIPWFEPRQRKAFLVAAAIVVLPCIYAAMVDAHFIQSCLDSISRCAALQVNNPAVEIGGAALFLRMGVSTFSSQILGIACSLAVLFFAARMLHRSGETLSRDPAAIMLLNLLHWTCNADSRVRFLLLFFGHCASCHHEARRSGCSAASRSVRLAPGAMAWHLSSGRPR